MLVLSRKSEETIIMLLPKGDSIKASGCIGEGDSAIVLTVLAIHGNRVSIGIEAPKEVKILRGELQRVSEETASVSELKTEGFAKEMTNENA